jgi:hypothetical protein
MNLPTISFSRSRSYVALREILPDGWQSIMGKVAKGVLTVCFLYLFGSSCIAGPSSKDDSIDRLVHILSIKDRIRSGGFRKVDLPVNADIKEVLLQAITNNISPHITSIKVASVHIIESRDVLILNEEYRAILFDSSRGKMIALLHYYHSLDGWWNRFYDQSYWQESKPSAPKP